MDIAEMISRRRRQILVHSSIYYRHNTNIISDLTFDKWGRELVELQEEYPEIAKECVYAEDFKDFDGSSGFDLPHANPEIHSKAVGLLRNNKLI